MRSDQKPGHPSSGRQISANRRSAGPGIASGFASVGKTPGVKHGRLV